MSRTMSMIRRTIIVAAAALLAATGLSISSDDRAEATFVQMSMLDWNAAGNVTGYGKGKEAWLLMKLQYYLDNNSPQASVITLQEVCYNQAQHLFHNYLIGDFGTNYAWYAALPSNSGACGGYAFGNAAFVRGGGASGTVEFVNQAPGPEDRGMACLNGIFGGAPPSGPVPIGACSVHTVHANPGIASAQTYEALNVVTGPGGTGGGYKYIMAGDFNQRFGSSETAPGTGIAATYAYPFYEADNVAAPNNRATFSSGKIDYIFLSQNANGYWKDLKLWPYHSDHRLLEAFFNLSF